MFTPSSLRCLAPALVAAVGGSAAFACDPPARVGHIVVGQPTGHVVTYRPAPVQQVRTEIVRVTQPDVIHVLVQPTPEKTATPRKAAKPSVRPVSERARTTTRPAVRPGSTLRLSGEFFGTDSGVARLETDDFSLDCEVLSWSPDGVTFTLPPVRLNATVAANLRLITPEGRVVKTRTVTLEAAFDLVEVRTVGDLGTVALRTDAGRAAN